MRKVYFIEILSVVCEFSHFVIRDANEQFYYFYEFTWVVSTMSHWFNFSLLQGSKDFALLSSKFGSRTVATEFRFKLSNKFVPKFDILSSGGKAKKKNVNHTEEQLGKTYEHK